MLSLGEAIDDRSGMNSIEQMQKRNFNEKENRAEMIDTSNFFI